MRLAKIDSRHRGGLLMRLSWLTVMVLGLAAGCANSTSKSPPSASPPATDAAPGEGSGVYAEAPSESWAEGPSGSDIKGASPPAAPVARGEATAASENKASRPSAVAPMPADRPGLATHWGESMASYVRSASFERATPDRPSALASLWYNDREGAQAMANREGYRQSGDSALRMAQSGIVVSLRDGQGRMLPGYHVGEKTFVVGDAGERYTIVIENTTPARFEIVASVDGLDVIDGKPASYAKRGYLIQPRSSLEIEGFRQSESSVAAFRFGSVRGSYAARTGDDRNVGVIGIAVFHERGVAMWPWNERELDRRQDANPFPRQFATPPPLTR